MLHMNTSDRGRERFMALLVILIAVCDSAAGQAPEFTEREVSFRNGSVVLGGTLVLPTVQGRHPTIVFLHGSV